MIRFHCKNCGQKFKVPDQKAGKKGKCPKCKNIIIVPQKAPAPAESAPAKSDTGKTEPPSPFTDPFLQQNSRLERIAESQPGLTQEQQFQMLRESAGLSPLEPTPPPQRKFPWLIDIFLYPMSFYGLINLAIFIGVPLLIDILGTILPIQLSCLFSLVALAVEALVFLYIYWYFAECVRDSADGGVRAPKGLGETPDLACMFWQTVNIIGCLGIFFGPFVLYILFAKRADIIFWLLLCFAVFFYPMGLLAVIMFDSARGLNPRLLISSISNTFFPYCGLILLFVTPAVLISLCPTKVQGSFLEEVIIRSVIVYIVLIGAHLLGLFYFRYQDKLNWEV